MTRRSDCSKWTSFEDDDELVVVDRLEGSPFDSKPGVDVSGWHSLEHVPWYVLAATQSSKVTIWHF